MSRPNSRSSTPPRRRARLSAQRGQSTVEFVVLTLALTPLVLLTPLVGKYLDIVQAT